MKKFLLTTLLILALVMTLTACGKSENVTANDIADIESAGNVAGEADVQSESEETSSNNNTADTPSVTYEGIDFNSTLPGKEWIQTTFPGVIDEPKIVIFNDETNKKKIVEYGEMILFDEADTFALFLPEGCIVTEGSYLTPSALVGKYYEIETFDMEKVKEEYLFWKDIDGGAQYKVLLKNNGVEQELMCMISLGY